MQVNEANVYPRFEPNAALAASAAPTAYSPASYGTKPGYDAPLPGPGFSYLEIGSREQENLPKRNDERRQPTNSGNAVTSFLEAGSRFINGVLAGMGIEVRCIHASTLCYCSGLNRVVGQPIGVV